MEQALALFENQPVRRIWYNDTWYFSVVNICGILAQSSNPGAYWRKLKQRLNNEESQVVTNCHGLKLEASDGKKYKTDCADIETLLRLIQSIPSPKAEPFKRWLAKVGYERIQEIENPELAVQRSRALYKAKGYPEDWIEKRIRSIAVREELTDEWQKRCVKSRRSLVTLAA